MVTLSNTWTTSYNNVPTQTSLQLQAQNVVYALKNALVAAGWVIEISSNSSTLNTSGTDTWSSSASVVWNTAGSAHSYVVVKSPAGLLPSSNQIRLLIDCGTGATNYHLLNITFATAAFTSSGSVNTIPTAPTNNIAFSNKQYLHSTVVNSKYHFQYVTAGTQIGNFLFEMSEDGTGRYHSVIGFLGSQGYETGDGWPGICIAAFQESSTGAFSASNLNSNSNSFHFSYDGTVPATFATLTCTYNTTPYMGNVTSTGSAITGVYFDYPIVLASTVKVTIRGYIVDIAWAPTGSSVTSGTVEPSSGSSTTAIMGEVWVPNGNVAPSL